MEGWIWIWRWRDMEGYGYYHIPNPCKPEPPCMLASGLENSFYAREVRMTDLFFIEL